MKTVTIKRYNWKGEIVEVEEEFVCWGELILEEMEEYGDTLPIIHSTLSQEEMDRYFYPGYGASTSVPVNAWTKNRVYFCIRYDGSDSIGSVPREPSDEKAIHHEGDGI